MKNNNKQNASNHLLENIKNFFSQEPLWKLFSLLVAIFMWMIVMNIINPTETKTFQASVTLENMSSLIDKGYVISNPDTIEKYTFSVKVEGTRPALDELNKSENKSNIKGKIDLSKVEVNDSDEFPKSYTVYVTPSLPSTIYSNDYNIVSYYPISCEVEIDKLSTKEVPVEINTYGEPASGYLAANLQSEVEKVTLKGPASKIAAVEKASATVDISGAKDDITSVCELSAYDEENAVVEGFTIEPESISVFVDIRKSYTVKINEPRTVGSLPEYLELLSVEWSPKSISVTSDSETAPANIDLPALDLTEIRGSTTKVIDISDILESAELEASSGQKKVTVTVNVGLTEGKEYTITSNMVSVTGLADGYEASLSDKVTVEIGGNANINASSLAPSVDLSGLTEGKYEVPLSLNVPSDAVVNGDVTINVTITKKEAVTQESMADAAQSSETDAESETDAGSSESNTEEAE